MKKKPFYFIFLIIAFGLILASHKAGYASEMQHPTPSRSDFSQTFQNIDISFSIAGGYRVDQLDWSIAGYLGADYWNVLSELVWKDIEIFQIQMRNMIVIKDTLCFKGNFDRGWIYSGYNKDTDYEGNDRSNPWSQSKNASEGGAVSDLSIGIGYVFKPFGSKLHLTPFLGFSHHNQELRITDGYQTISKPIYEKQVFPAPLGPFSGLDSTYKTNWLGPWLGGDITYKWSKTSQLTVSFEYHWTDYYAKADWNLIDRFEHPKSFEHSAVGSGIVLGMDWRSQLIDNWYYIIEINYHHWETDQGIDRTFFSDGSVSETKLNSVNWKSAWGTLGLAYFF